MCLRQLFPAASKGLYEVQVLLADTSQRMRHALTLLVLPTAPCVGQCQQHARLLLVHCRYGIYAVCDL